LLASSTTIATTVSAIASTAATISPEFASVFAAAAGFGWVNRNNRSTGSVLLPLSIRYVSTNNVSDTPPTIDNGKSQIRVAFRVLLAMRSSASRPMVRQGRAEPLTRATREAVS